MLSSLCEVAVWPRMRGRWIAPFTTVIFALSACGEGGGAILTPPDDDDDPPTADCTDTTAARSGSP